MNTYDESHWCVQLNLSGTVSSTIRQGVSIAAVAWNIHDACSSVSCFGGFAEQHNCKLVLLQSRRPVFHAFWCCGSSTFDLGPCLIIRMQLPNAALMMCCRQDGR